MKVEVIKQIALIIGVSAVLIAGLTWWASNYSTNADIAADQINIIESEENEAFEVPLTVEEQVVTNPTDINTMNPTAVITTNKGVIELELFTDTMPVTAGNFVTLAEDGFFNNTKFHRVIENFMIQAGDPQTTDDSLEARWGTGGPGYAIADEHVEGDLLTNTRGTIAMANSGPNSGGSQFFINLVDNSFLDFNKEPMQSKHPVFGRVVAGMEVVDTIGAVETKPGDRPVDPVVIETVTIVQN